MKHLYDDEIQDMMDRNDSMIIIKGHEHLHECSDCREKVKKYLQLYRMLNYEEDLMIPNDFADQVMSRLAKSLEPIRTFWDKLSVFVIIISAIFAMTHCINWELYFHNGYKWLQLFDRLPQILEIPFYFIRDIFNGSALWLIFGCGILLILMTLDKYIIKRWRSEHF